MITTVTSFLNFLACSSFLLLVSITVPINAFNDKLNVAPGYYAFETASRRHGQPPRVRPPPYYSSDLPCPGVIKSGIMYSPKDTLCGDLNKGFIPRNPMGHAIHNQPYPFEIIKNKTLHFLAKALPFLKEDIDSIPKVVKLNKDRPNSAQSINNFQEVPFPQGQDPYLSMAKRKKRSTIGTGSETVSTKAAAEEDRKPKFMSTVLESAIAAASSSNGNHNGASAGGVHQNNWDTGNLTSTLASLLPPSESRQKPCESKDGIMCQVMQSLGSGSLLGTINQAAQVIQAAQSLGTIGQGTLSLANLVGQLSQGANANGGKTQSGLSQIMTLLEDPPKTVHGTSSSSSASSDSSSIAQGSSNFSPILAVLDYLASNSNEKSAISSILPARRKKPMDLEELASEAVAAVGGGGSSGMGVSSGGHAGSMMGSGNGVSGLGSMNRVPPTPCPSLEEYIAPVFARNYQGVWKYIVQIPHEGYFTQTVQKTSCIKGKCDFMDGSCHESPRWVSLLVAEIFYPDARFPNPVPPPPSNLHLSAEAASYPGSKMQQFQSIVSSQSMVNPSPQMVGTDPYLQQQQHKPQQYQPQMQPGMVQMAPQAAHQQMHNLQVNMNQAMNQQQQQQQFRPISSWRANDEMSSMASTGSRRMQRQMNGNENEFKENSLNNNSGESSKESSSNGEPECDGVDKVGCYLIRVYYDWFLVPGSCKCWKKNSQGSLDTLKKIFIGK